MEILQLDLMAIPLYVNIISRLVQNDNPIQTAVFEVSSHLSNIKVTLARFNMDTNLLVL